MSVRIWGDEYYQIVESLDEYTLIRDPKTQEICYADLSTDGDDLVSTKVRVEKTKPSKLKLTPHLRIKPEATRKKVAAARAAWNESQIKALTAAPIPLPGTLNPSTSPAPDVSPGPISSGNVLGICLLVDFPDDHATIPAANAANMCNQTGYTGYSNNGSVHDYYNDVSDGQLNYTNYVMTAYYRAAHPKSYYDDVAIAYPLRARELIIEALNYLESSGFDFSLYDSNHDGRIDALNCFYAGTTTAGWAKGLWPHKSALTWSADGVNVGYYQITDMGASLEIGTFCHENGHMLLGWPDLYDYGYESNGVGRYCLMCSSGTTNPVEPCAYLKLLSGWANLTVLGTPLGGIQLRSGINDICKFPRPGVPNEYYLVENRQKTGRDTNLPDAGLAIWHIDTSGSNDYEQMTASNHYLVTLVQADGRWDLEHKANYGDTSDLYDAAAYDACSPYTTPNTHWWNGVASGLDVNMVSASGATMTFNFMEPDALGISPADGLTAAGIKGQTFTPNFKTFTLSNSGDIPITWSATKTAAWLDLSKTGGTLAPGGSDSVTVTFNATANGLNFGTYTDTVTFTDQATANTMKRKVTLTVTDYQLSWDIINSPQSIDQPFLARVTARNSQGVVHQGFTGAVNLRAFTSVTSQIGSGTSGWNYPLASYYHDARLQVIYLASEIGAAGPINSLSLDVATIPGQVLNNWTIRMKHTTLSAYSSAAWDATGWTTVYQANQTISQTGWVRFDFTTPFIYNGTQNLLIDFSFNNSSYTTDGSCRYSTPGGNRSCFYRVDSTQGDPLTWSGTTPSPSMNTYVPNIKISKENTVSLSPTVSGNFVEGIWNGQVTILETKNGVKLGANDGLGHDGTSNLFDVTTATNNPPTDITLSASTVAENQSVGTTVGTLSATDPNTAQTFTYDLVSGTGSTDNGSFSISGNTLLTAASFNYEATASYSIRVRTTDSGTPAQSYEKTLTIGVSDVNEAPSVASINKTVSAGAVLAFSAADFTGAFIDPDSGGSLQRVRIVSLPAHGTLKLGVTDLAVNQEILPGQLGTLTYTPTDEYGGPDVFAWNGSDGSLYASASANVNLEVDLISISVDPATWVIGPQTLNYVGESGTCTIANNGNVTVDIAVKAGDGSGGWQLGSVVGINAFKVDVDTGDDGSYEMILQKADQSLFTSIMGGASRALGLRYSAPNRDTFGAGIAQNFTITFTATQHLP